jgi:hypothetical protein
MKTISLILLLFFFHNSFSQINNSAVDRLNNYRDKVFAVFNKCNSQDEKINNAIKAKNINNIESGRNVLLQYAVEGMKELNAMENFDDDPSLKYSCRDVLKFYKQLAESDLTQVRDFFIVEENFLKIKNEFEKKPAKRHSQAEISAYNSEIKKYNAAGIRYAQINSFIAASRKQTLYNWNASVKIFMDSHKSKT